MDSPYRAFGFTIAWTEVGGAFHTVGRPILFVHASGFLLEEESGAPLIRPSGVISVLGRSRSATDQWLAFESELSPQQIRDTANALLRCGWLDHDPDVAEKLDTGDSWARLDLSLSLEHHRQAPAQKRRAFSVRENCTGFMGPDAAALRAFLRDIVHLAGEGTDELLESSMYSA